jgi:hypothetical protein
VEVGRVEEPGVVDLELGAGVGVAGLEQPVLPAVAPGLAHHAPAGRARADPRAVGNVAGRAVLDPRADDLRAEPPFAVGRAQRGVEPAGVRVVGAPAVDRQRRGQGHERRRVRHRAQVAGLRRGGVAGLEPVDRGAEDADRRVGTEVAAQPERGEVGQRLDQQLLGGGPAARDHGVLLRGQRVERCDRRALGDQAGQLERAPDPTVGQRLGDRGVAGEGRARRRRADPPAVEQAEPGREQIGALEEERPLLRQVGLGRRQVEHDLIGLDRAEIRVDRAVEGQRRREAELEIGADVAALIAAVERILAVAEHEPARVVDQRLGEPLGAQPGDTVDRAVVRDLALGGARHEGPLVDLAAALQIAPDLEPERVDVAVVAQRDQRDLELGRPALVVARRHRVPPAVPVGAHVGVVEPDAVELHAGRVDLEVIRAGLVVLRADVDGDLVAVDVAVAPGQPADDLLGVRVEAAHRDVDRVVIVQHAQLGLLGRRLGLVREVLRESGLEPRVLPGRVVELAVDVGRF